MDLLSDDKMVEVGKPDIAFLQEAYNRTRADLEEWVDQRERDYNTRNCRWSGKSDDYKKHNRNAETGEAFPWDGASDHESREVDDIINTKKVLCMNAIRKAYINAVPVESQDVARAAVISNFMRWLIKAKMKEFYKEIDHGIDNLLEKSLMVHYVYWDAEDQKILQELTLDQLALMLEGTGANMEAFMAGELDDTMATMIQQATNVSAKKAKGMITELRNTGSTTMHLTRATKNQPAIRTLPPDEDFFMPVWTIDPQQAPYCFHIVHMTPQQLRAKVELEDWDEDFVEAAIETVGQQQDPGMLDEWTRSNYTDGRYDETVRIIYAYQRLIDEDAVPGIYCTVMCYNVTDHYGKHYLLDYAHGQYPFVITPLERTSKRIYAARSIPEVAESHQKIIKAETDASIDRQSLATVPPINHIVGRKPTKMGPAVKIPVLRHDEWQWAPTPKYDAGSYVLREYVENNLNKYFGRSGQGVDPVEAQNKQQHLVDTVLQHMTEIFDQVYSLYQQYGPDEEYFRVAGVQDMQKYSKGKPGERYDFWVEFDVSTQDPGQMIDRVKAVGELGGMLDRQGTLDTQELLKLGVSQLLPGAADKIIQPVEQAQQRAVAEERQTIAELVAGVPANVRENDAHQIKLQVFEQWLQEPGTKQKLANDPFLQENVENYYKQRTFQIEQRQNAQIGRTGAAPTQFGQTAQQV